MSGMHLDFIEQLNSDLCAVVVVFFFSIEKLAVVEIIPNQILFEVGRVPIG